MTIGDTPLDIVQPSIAHDLDTLSRVCQGLAKLMQGSEGSSSGTTTFTSMAGTMVYSFGFQVDTTSYLFTWILDSGATDHMAFDFSMLSNFHKLAYIELFFLMSI